MNTNPVYSFIYQQVYTHVRNLLTEEQDDLSLDVCDNRSERGPEDKGDVVGEHTGKEVGRDVSRIRKRDAHAKG